MTDQEAKVPRRGFLKILSSLFAALGLTAIVGPAIAYFWPSKLEEMPTEPVSAGSEDSIPEGEEMPTEPVSAGSEGSIPEGESKTVRFGRYPALVINTPERGIVAYSAVCRSLPSVSDQYTGTRDCRLLRCLHTLRLPCRLEPRV